jgi:hypothetical protein
MKCFKILILLTFIIFSFEEHKLYVSFQSPEHPEFLMSPMGIKSGLATPKFLADDGIIPNDVKSMCEVYTGTDQNIKVFTYGDSYYAECPKSLDHTVFTQNQMVVSLIDLTKTILLQSFI